MTRCMNCGEDIEEEKCKCCEEDIAIFVKKKPKLELKCMLSVDIAKLKEKLLYLSAKHIARPGFSKDEDPSAKWKPIPAKLRQVRSILKEKLITFKMILEAEEIKWKR